MAAEWSALNRVTIVARGVIMAVVMPIAISVVMIQTADMAAAMPIARIVIKAGSTAATAVVMPAVIVITTGIVIKAGTTAATVTDTAMVTAGSRSVTMDMVMATRFMQLQVALSVAPLPMRPAMATRAQLQWAPLLVRS
jgi:hypothetical protein